MKKYLVEMDSEKAAPIGKTFPMQNIKSSIFREWNQDLSSRNQLVEGKEQQPKLSFFSITKLDS